MYILLLTTVVTLLWLQHMLEVLACATAGLQCGTSLPKPTASGIQTEQMQSTTPTWTQLYSDSLADIILMKTDSQADCFSALACRIVFHYTKCRQHCSLLDSCVMDLLPWLSDTCSQRCTDLQSLVKCLEHKECDTVCKLMLYCITH